MTNGGRGVRWSADGRPSKCEVRTCLLPTFTGPCTATGGYLGFYEIQEVLKNGANPIHDEEAAVNYLVFDSNQWISCDDEDTFKQKVD